MASRIRRKRSRCLRLMGAGISLSPEDNDAGSHDDRYVLARRLAGALGFASRRGRYCLSL
ncbi:hypothetical protein [Scardovia inopinata]|uniref:hypothetical protein n=1 Tax=Scardovia inopinata TaxID=78259 RepID=UPI001494890B|nr:hypothetical protein [Scardovia inopinata]